jgi:DNA polymerase theta
MNTNTNDIRKVFQILGISHEVCQTYEKLGLTQLHAWQSDCLFSTGVLRGTNLVYCAPTSGGKTLVAELVLLKTVITLQKKAIFILPFVSLVLEKEKHLNKIVSFYNQTQPKEKQIKIQAYYGEKGMSRSYRENIIICTIEKANTIFNTLVLRKRANLIGCLIFDETHVLGNKMNGYLLEILITKIKLFENRVNQLKREEQNRSLSNAYQPVVLDSFHIQIIALSATMGNVSELANWLKAKLFVTDFRPIPLIERVKAGNEIFSPDGTLIEVVPPVSNNPQLLKDDPDQLCYLCSTGLRKGQQIIVFCPTKQQCSTTAELLSKYLQRIYHEVDSRKQQVVFAHRQQVVQDLYGTDQDDQVAQQGQKPSSSAASSSSSTLKQFILNGLAYHHSSLTTEERISVEKAFRLGYLSVLCATTTLAAGVNLPAGRIIIRSLTLGKDQLTITNYKQCRDELDEWDKHLLENLS